MKSLSVALGVLFPACMLMSSIAFAGPVDDPAVQNRLGRQEQRIDQGVASGQLTPREAGLLEAEQAKIRQDEMRMKADGILTKRERTRLHDELDRASRHIYTQKHDRQRAR